jgi:hypothetical protein
MPEPSSALGRRIDEIRASAPAPAQSAIDMTAPTSRTADLFLIQPPQVKQVFFKLVLKSAAWGMASLQTQFQDPFENLRRSNLLRLSRYLSFGLADRRETKFGSPDKSVQNVQSISGYRELAELRVCPNRCLMWYSTISRSNKTR